MERYSSWMPPVSTLCCIASRAVRTGDIPFGGVIRDAAGNLYGTSLAGGSVRACNNGFGCGTVFKLDRRGIETVLYNFTGATDGANPQASLIQDANGNLYGTTATGGVGCGSLGCGTVFKLDPTGTESVLHSFTDGADGGYPFDALVPNGESLFGTTQTGGAFGHGTVFKLDKTGKQTVLHSFTGAADGKSPDAGVIRDGAGNLYGTTYSGG